MICEVRHSSCQTIKLIYRNEYTKIFVIYCLKFNFRLFKFHFYEVFRPNAQRHFQIQNETIPPMANNAQDCIFIV